jgi:hypothetical protein
LLVKLLNRSARSIKDGKQQTSQVISLDLLLGIVWLLLFVIFRRREWSRGSVEGIKRHGHRWHILVFNVVLRTAVARNARHI